MDAPIAALPPEDIQQVKDILKWLFQGGSRWVKNVQRDDWRYTHYVSSNRRRVPASAPPNDGVGIDEAHLQKILGYIRKAASGDTAQEHLYIVVRAEKRCIDGNGIALLRPVLKKDFDDQPQLNFHVWFNCLLPGGGNEYLMVGWRLEGPEGVGCNHDFFHAQPLSKYGLSESVYSVSDHFPTRFPTVPLPASNVVELCLSAAFIACGKGAVKDLAREGESAEVRAAAQAFLNKLA